jgi:hypothetical protein
MMSRKKLCLGLSLVTLTAAGLIALRLTTPRHRINEENFNKLRLGMTKPEVEALFGVPAGDYDEGRNDFFDHRSEQQRQADWAGNGGAPTDWGSNGFIAHVWFDENGKVNHWTFVQWDPAPRSIFDRLRRLLRL